jgi:hypothetical protein
MVNVRMSCYDVCIVLTVSLSFSCLSISFSARHVLIRAFSIETHAPFGDETGNRGS